MAADRTRCPPTGGRTNVVFGTGDADAYLMFVGEGPGAQEGEQGLPFVGWSGRLLDEMLVQEIRLDRRFLARALGVIGPVTSPTFTLAHHYEISGPTAALLVNASDS